MAKRHKLRHQIIIDRINNPENLWSYSNLIFNTHTNQNVIWNIIWDSILKQKDLYRYWNCISQNANITWTDIQNNPDLPWNWTYVGINKNITWDIILNNPDHQWDWEFLSHYKSITWSIIKQNIDFYKQKLNWNGMGCNFDFEILENLELSVPWNFHNLSNCLIINWDIVIKYKDQDWNWDALSDCQNLDYNIILDHIDKPWNWDKISLSLKVTSLILSTNSNWNWNHLCYNKSVTEEILIDYKDKPWNYTNLSQNKNISKEFVLNNPDKAWNYNILAYNNIIIMDKITDWNTVIHNTKLPLEFMKENIDLFTTEQHWQQLSMNKNMNFDFVLEYKDKPLNWFQISYSNCITYEIVNNNRHLPWNWNSLSTNQNMLDIEVEFKLKAREHIAAYKILQYWLRAYYNPEYLICQQRLLREFENLTKV
jgi:hypothetical protein